MNEPLICVFDRLEDALLAREALLSAGFDGEAVLLRSNDDESGPVEGNFAAGDPQPGPLGRIDDGSPTPPPGTDGGDPYDARLRRVVQRGTQTLLVVAPDEAARRRAVRIAERCNGHAPRWDAG